MDPADYLLVRSMIKQLNAEGTLSLNWLLIVLRMTAFAICIDFSVCIVSTILFLTALFAALSLFYFACFILCFLTVDLRGE